MKGSDQSKPAKPTSVTSVSPSKSKSSTLPDSKSNATGNATDPTSNSHICTVMKCSGVSKIGANKGPMNQDCFFQHVELDGNTSRHLLHVTWNRLLLYQEFANFVNAVL